MILHVIKRPCPAALFTAHAVVKQLCTTSFTNTTAACLDLFLLLKLIIDGLQGNQLLQPSWVCSAPALLQQASSGKVLPHRAALQTRHLSASNPHPALETSPCSQCRRQRQNSCCMHLHQKQLSSWRLQSCCLALHPFLQLLLPTAPYLLQQQQQQQQEQQQQQQQLLGKASSRHRPCHPRWP